MGTMIQRHKLTEADFRGERFADHPRDLKGDSDVLVLTRPDVISASTTSISRPAPTSSRPTRSAATAIAQGDYGLEALVYEHEPRRRAARARAPPTSGRRRRRTGRASSPARWGRRIERCRFRPTSTTPRFARPHSTRCATAYKDQVRGLIDGGSDILLLETIFDTLIAKAALVAIENVFDEPASGCR